MGRRRGNQQATILRSKWKLVEQKQKEFSLSERELLGGSGAQYVTKASRKKMRGDACLVRGGGPKKLSKVVTAGTEAENNGSVKRGALFYSK